MGLEIDKYNGRNVPQELVEIYKLKQDIKDDVQKTNKKKLDESKEQKEKVLLDTYKRSLVSDSIEQQIKEQEAKIKEINENLEGLRDEYYETLEKEHDARYERLLKERELYQKEVSEGSLKRIFLNWRKKYIQNQKDKEIADEYRIHHADYDTASEERIDADKAYDIADTDAYSAISAHNSADTAFLGGLWSKQDAYWDLAKMKQRYAFAKMRESSLDL